MFSSKYNIRENSYVDIVCKDNKINQYPKRYQTSFISGQIFNNSNNNYKTLFSKRIQLGGAPSTGAEQTHSPGTMQSSTTDDQVERTLRKDKQV